MKWFLAFIGIMFFLGFGIFFVRRGAPCFYNNEASLHAYNAH